MKAELKATESDREYYQMIANDYNSLQEEFQKQRLQLGILSSQAKEGTAESARQTVILEDELEARKKEKERMEAEMNSELKSYREMAKQCILAAQQKNEKLQEENDQMREELRAYNMDVDVDNITPEQQAVVRVALQKQAKVYRQREEDLQKRILELEEQLTDPIDVSAAINEAVREIVGRAADIQTRLKAENAALRKRIRELEPMDADDDFENIEDIVKAIVEGPNPELEELLEQVEMLYSRPDVTAELKERCSDLLVMNKQLREELDERDLDIEKLDTQAIELSKHCGAMGGLLEKYAGMCGVSEEELKYLLIELGRDEGEEVEVLNESNYVFDARMKGIVHNAIDPSGYS